MRLSNREFKSLRNYLGRVVRDIERKVAGDEELKCVFFESLSLAQRMLSQMHQDKNKIYSINAPEVECISKGKAHHNNSYDGHTLEEAVL